MAHAKHILALPIAVLLLAGVVMTAFLGGSLVISGAREGAVGQVLLGSIVSALWLMMLWKTIRAPRLRS